MFTRIPLDVVWEPVDPPSGSVLVILGVIAAALAVFAVVYIVRAILRRHDWWKK